MRRLAALGAVSLAVGCGTGIVSEPPNEAPQEIAGERVADNAAAEGIARVQTPALSQDGVERRVRRMTARVRNLSCDGLATGSGFAIGENLLGTNRHVLAGAKALEINTWDGSTLEVAAAQVHVLGDLAIVRIDGTLPVVADHAPSIPQAGPIIAVGYPLGGPLTLSRGKIVDRVAGERYDHPGTVLRVTANIQPGSSGGPLVDTRGRVVGVIFAVDTENGLGLAIPLDDAQILLEVGGLTSVPECGYE